MWPLAVSDPIVFFSFMHFYQPFLKILLQLKDAEQQRSRESSERPGTSTASINVSSSIFTLPLAVSLIYFLNNTLCSIAIFSFNEHKAQQQSVAESNEEPDSNKSVDDGASVKKYLYYQDWQLTVSLICFSSKPTLELNHSKKKQNKKTTKKTTKNKKNQQTEIYQRYTLHRLLHLSLVRT